MPSNLDRTVEARAVRYQKLAGRLERAAAACMLVASPVLAQDPDTIRAAPDTIVFELSPVEVLVSIAPRAAPSIGSGMPARISTVGRDQIGSWKPRLVTDLLSTQAGVSLYDDLGSPYKLNLSARGFNVGPTVGLPTGWLLHRKRPSRTSLRSLGDRMDHTQSVRHGRRDVWDLQPEPGKRGAGARFLTPINGRSLRFVVRRSLRAAPSGS